jgi:hypothetical protein
VGAVVDETRQSEAALFRAVVADPIVHHAMSEVISTKAAA